MADRVDIADLAVNFVSSGETGVMSGLQGISEHLLGIAGPAGEAAAAVVAAGIGIAGASVVMAADFQESMTQLVTGAGESKSNLQMVSDGILGIARDTGESTSQLAQGMYMVESAGHHGADGLDVLKAAAEGAKVGNADLGTVADATTTILADYPNVVNGASGAVNTLIATVAQGKTHMQDLAGALAQVLPTASAAKVGLNDVMGGMATMTAEGVPAANAATYLRQMLISLNAPTKAGADALKSIGLTTGQVSDAMKQSLPGALQLITDHLNKVYKEGSPQWTEAVKNIAGGSKQMQGFLDLTGQHLATFQADVGTVANAVTKGGKSITGWTEVQGDFNQVLARGREQVETMMISLGLHLLPVLTRLADYVVSNVLPAVGGFLGFLETHQAIVKTVALVLGGALVGALVAATVAAWGLAAGVVAATWPFLAIGAAVGLLAAGLIWAYQHIGPFHDAVDAIGAALQGAIQWVQKSISEVKVLGNVFADVGTLIHDVVTGQWGKLAGDVTRIQTDWNNDMRALANQQAADQKKAADKAALDAEQAALKKKQGVLNQAADEADKQAKIAQQEYDYDTKMANASKDAATKAYYQKAADVAKAQMTEQQQVAASARQEAGQVSQQMTDLKNNATAAARDTASQVLAHLTTMSGGSIQQSRRMRQTVTADLASMQQDGVADAVKLAQGVSGQMQTMSQQTGAWGKDAAVNFANGLLAGQGNVDGAVNQLVMRVAAKMQHSKPSEGPLRDDDVWGLHLAENFAAGLVRGAAAVAEAAGGVAQAATGVVPGGLGTLSAGALGPLPGVGGAVPGGTGQTVVVLSLDGRQLSEAVVPHLPRTFAIGTGARSW